MRIAFEKFSRELDDVVKPLILDSVRRAAPGHGPQHQEHLRRITARRVGNRIEITAGEPWTYVIHGTRAHVIEPRHISRNPRCPPALRFEWHGQRVFFRRVSHPGTKPNDFPRRGWLAVKPAVEALAREAARHSIETDGDSKTEIHLPG